MPWYTRRAEEVVRAGPPTSTIQRLCSGKSRRWKLRKNSGWLISGVFFQLRREPDGKFFPRAFLFLSGFFPGVYFNFSNGAASRVIYRRDEWA